MGSCSFEYDPFLGPIVRIFFNNPRGVAFSGKKLIALIDPQTTILTVNKKHIRDLELPQVNQGGPVQTLKRQTVEDGFGCSIWIEGLDRVFYCGVVGVEDIEEDRALLGRNFLDEFIITLNSPEKGHLTITDPRQHPLGRKP